MMKKYMLSGFAFVLMISGLLIGIDTSAGPRDSANGHGTLSSIDENGDTVNRQFSFSAQRQADGSVKGHAVLRNPAFAGDNGKDYYLNLDITCMKVYPGNIAVFGGFPRRTNDSNLNEAAFFSVQDNGEPGKGTDKISRVYFFDDDPNTTGDPQACEITGPTDLPLEPIESGNIQVKP